MMINRLNGNFRELLTFQNEKRAFQTKRTTKGSQQHDAIDQRSKILNCVSLLLCLVRVKITNVSN